MKESKPRPRERSAEENRIRVALQRLVQTDEWAVFVEFSRKKIENATVDPVAPNAGALFVQHGRRSFHRELIEGLGDRVSDERRRGNDGE